MAKKNLKLQNYFKKHMLLKSNNFSIYRVLNFKLNFITLIKFKGYINPRFFKMLNSIIINQNLFFFFKDDFKKFFKIFQRHGKKYLSYKVFCWSFSLNKRFFNLDFFIILYYFINLFKLPLNITSKKKGRKLIIIPEVFSPLKLINVTLHLFYKSLVLYNTNFKKYTYTKRTFLEIYSSFNNFDTFFNENYTKLMYTFLRNRS